MSTVHTRPRREAEHSLVDSLALPVGATIATLAGGACALVYAAACGATLAGSQRLPAASYFTGLGIAQRLTRTPTQPWLAWPHPDRAAMPHDAATWYAAASLPLTACLALLCVLGLVASRAWQSHAGRDERRALGRAPSAERGPGKPRVRLTTRPAASEGRITLGHSGLGRVFAPDPEAHVMVVAPEGTRLLIGPPPA